jgi:hypothetical protein
MEFVPSPKVLGSLTDNLPAHIINPSKIPPAGDPQMAFFERCFLSQPLCAETYTSIFHRNLGTDAPGLPDLVFALAELSGEGDPFDVIDVNYPRKPADIVRDLLRLPPERVVAGFARRMAALGLAIDPPIRCRSHEDVKRQVAQFFRDRARWDHQVIVQIPDLALNEPALRIEVPVKLRVKGVDYVRTDLLAAEMRWCIGRDGAVSNAARGDRPFTFRGRFVDRGLGLRDFIRQVNADFVCYGASPVSA